MQEAHVWSKRLDLAHDELDGEHHLQIAMIGALAEAIEERRPVMARRLAEQLEAYSAAHFTGEQLVMESSEYPRAGAHQSEHEGLVKHIQELRDRLRSDDVGEALTMALDLLTGISAHIASSDAAFAQHLEERRGRPTQRR
jgi:hemerythrin-like metal-binding protein